MITLGRLDPECTLVLVPSLRLLVLVFVAGVDCPVDEASS